MQGLEIKNLSKNYDQFSLKNINLELPIGYILGYIGQNGSGKTTTLKLIMNYIKSDSGEIKIFNQSFNEDEIQYKSIIGYIADDCYFPGSFTAKDISNSMASFYPTFDKNKFSSFLNKWNLPMNKKISGFSKGMKVKLMFAAVLSRETKLLLLDEPTSGLDPVIRNEILDLLQDYISEGDRSVLFSTHIMSDLEKIADYLYFIDNGETIFYDTKDNILENYLMIKGGNSDLTQDLQNKLIGLKKSKLGFEGLIKAKDKFYVNKNMMIENPTIEEIVVFHINGMGR